MSVVVTIHGIMTRRGSKDNWQREFEEWLLDKNIGVTYRPFEYGWLGPINSWRAKCIDWITDLLHLPRLTRRTRINEFKAFLIKVREDHPRDNIHIVAHSFGTFITTEALMELDVEYPSFKACSVSLVAGIISSNLTRSGYNYLLDNNVGSLYAWSSHNDRVVRFIAVPPFGHLGYWGLVRPGIEEDRIRPIYQPVSLLRAFNNHTGYEHSGYFDDADTFYPKVVDNMGEAEEWSRSQKK